MWLCLAFLFLFLGVASVDGFYFHIRKYRLHARAASRREHILHTVNALLLLPQILLTICVRPEGAWLCAAALLALVIFGVELLDVLSEGESRADLGGLTSAEYAMHFAMASLRAGYFAAFFAGFGAEDLFAPSALRPVAPWLAVFGLCVLAPAVGAATVHVVLAVTGQREIERQSTFSTRSQTAATTLRSPA